jgi:hypothetical protein
MIDFGALILIGLILAGIWIVEHLGVYLRWMAGCLISVALVAIGGVGLVLLRDFLINL